MPKETRKDNGHLQYTPIQLVLLLVKFILIKIGSIPIFLMGIIVDILYFLITRGFRQVKWIFKHAQPKKRLRFLSIFRRISSYIKYNVPKRVKISLAFSIILISFLAYTFITVQTASFLPSPTHLTSFDRPLTTEFYDRNGTLLYRLYEGRNRTLVKLEDLPTHFIQATIAIEDQNFYKHHGFDPIAIARAIRHNLSNERTQGGSTITQQLIKNTLLTPEQTYVRKFKEIILAVWTEWIYSKEEILTMYLNESPYGGPTWGIEAAALTYFGKSAHDLDLAQSAFLAGLPASPTEYSPYGNHPELARTRQLQVLRRMVEDKYITQIQADDAAAEILTLLPQQNNIHAPHFVMYVKDLLSQEYGTRVVSQGGLKVTTTLDLKMQDQVQQIVKDEIDKLVNLKVGNGAAMVTDAKTGQILAMVGSRDYHYPQFGNFNVTINPRQPGSSIKPITYATAFKQGFTPGNTILDTPVRFGNYSPVNYDNRFHGPISVRVALGSSYNVPAVKLLATIGLDKMIETAKSMGISTFDDPRGYGLSLTLGGGEVKMIDMMEVYGTFSQMGTLHHPKAILKVVDSHGNTLEEADDQGQQVLPEEIAYLITSILADNNARAPAFGPHSLLIIPGHQVAVKTGTTDSKKDNWTFGYTPDYVVGVWVGNNDNSPMDPTLTSGITGAAPIWNKIMNGLLKDKEPITFERPKGVIDAVIDGRKDLAVAGILPKGLVRVIAGRGRLLMSDQFSFYATSSAITSR